MSLQMIVVIYLETLYLESDDAISSKMMFDDNL